jgi:hypothetical protein
MRYPPYLPGKAIIRLIAAIHIGIICAPPRCRGVTVTLDAGGAATYAQRAIPGSEFGQESCTFHPLLPLAGPCCIRRSR